MKRNRETFVSLAPQLSSSPTPESLRQVVYGYRRPGPDLAVALEAKLGKRTVTAAALLDRSLYRRQSRSRAA